MIHHLNSISGFEVTSKTRARRLMKSAGLCPVQKRPISGRTQAQYAAPLHNTPIWAFHGADDPVVPASESQKLVDALQMGGGNARLTVFPNTGHDAWRQVYTDPKVFEWMLKQSLEETATR